VDTAEVRHYADNNGLVVVVVVLWGVVVKTEDDEDGTGSSVSGATAHFPGGTHGCRGS
jgi:hypothetical protein